MTFARQLAAAWSALVATLAPAMALAQQQAGGADPAAGAGRTYGWLWLLAAALLVVALFRLLVSRRHHHHHATARGVRRP